MTNELTFITNALFDKVTFDKDADRWMSYFTDKIYANCSGVWRLLQKNKIVFVALDNGQQFGLVKPINLAEELNKELKGKRLS